jgi:hypothetical protein
MLSLQDILGIIAILLGVVAYAFYIRGIVQGKVKPHAFSWGVWGLLTGIAFLAQLAGGGGPGAWVTGFTAICSFAFVIVGLTKSSRVYINKSDWVFLAVALATIPIWYFSGDPLWSVLIITITDACAFIPTFRKAYNHPDTENARTYALSGIKFVPGLFALQTFSVTTALYPASLVLMNLLFVVMLLWRRKALAK